MGTALARPEDGEWVGADLPLMEPDGGTHRTGREERCPFWNISTPLTPREFVILYFI